MAAVPTRLDMQTEVGSFTLADLPSSSDGTEAVSDGADEFGEGTVDAKIGKIAVASSADPSDADPIPQQRAGVVGERRLVADTGGEQLVAASSSDGRAFSDAAARDGEKSQNLPAASKEQSARRHVKRGRGGGERGAKGVIGLGSSFGRRRRW